MIVIRHLYHHLRTRKKNSHPQPLLQALQFAHAQDQSSSSTCAQKGIILSLLAEACLLQFELFKKILFNFSTKVQSGSFDIETTKTKTKKHHHERGNTTTVKRKKPLPPEKGRNGLNLDQMLERQLSTPNNTGSRSQKQAHTLQSNQNARFSTLQKIQMGCLLQQGLVTPLKQLKETEEQVEDIKLEEYRALINQSSLSKQKKGTKNKESTKKTRKKPSKTQNLHQQINADISLNLCSQVSVRKELEAVLEFTKKKKSSQKESVLCHSLFGLPIDPKFTFQNKSNIKLFFGQNNYKFSSKKALLDATQKSNISFEWDNSQPAVKNAVDLRQNDEFESKLGQVIKQNKSFSFQKFVGENHFSKEEKSVLFYDLLCNCQKYRLSQENVQSFGDIKMRMEGKQFG